MTEWDYVIMSKVNKIHSSNLSWSLFGLNKFYIQYTM